jgi:hypothetical protein
VKMERSRPGGGRRAPFPFFSMLQNGPRRQGYAAENLFNPGKDSPPPRTNRAPLPAPGRSTDLSMRRERGRAGQQGIRAGHGPRVPPDRETGRRTAPLAADLRRHVGEINVLTQILCVDGQIRLRVARSAGGGLLQKMVTQRHRLLALEFVSPASGRATRH